MDKTLAKDSYKLAKLPLPIVAAAINDAETIAGDQPNKSRTESIERNILAVWAVKSYLEMMGYETNLAASLCRDPIALFAEIEAADLAVKDLGRLECIVIEPGATTIPMPDEERDDCLAYLLVEVETGENCSANLLGFWYVLSRDTGLTELSTDDSDLQPPDELIEYFFRIQSLKAMEEFKELAASFATDFDREKQQQLVNEVVMRLERIYRGTDEVYWEDEGGIVIEETVDKYRENLEGLVSPMRVREARETDEINPMYQELTKKMLLKLKHLCDE